MSYGWQAWKNRQTRAPGNPGGRSRQAKERAYGSGFRAGAKDLGLPADLADTALCPAHILDDPGIDAAGAHDLGRWDAKMAAKARGVA